MLAIFGCWNYEHNRAVRRMCEMSGRHDVWFEHPRTPREALDSLCADYASDDEDVNGGLEP